MGRHNVLVAVKYQGRPMLRERVRMQIGCDFCLGEIPKGNIRFRGGRKTLCEQCALTAGDQPLFQRGGKAVRS